MRLMSRSRSKRLLDKQRRSSTKEARHSRGLHFGQRSRQSKKPSHCPDKPTELRVEAEEMGGLEEAVGAAEAAAEETVEAAVAAARRSTDSQ